MMKRFSMFTNNARRFLKHNESGSISVEAVLVFPMLMWMATLMFTFFDVYKVQNASYRGNYTVSDMLSRQTTPVDQTFIDGMLSVFRYMTYTPASETSWLRVSVVRCTKDCNDENQRKLEWVWSHATSGQRSLDNTDFVYYKDKIPLLPIGDQLILVETKRHYTPPFAQSLVPFGARDIDTYVVTRPRFANQLCWNSCVTGNGSGSGGSNVGG